MRFCPRCNLLYHQGAVCSRCGGWLYDAPQQAMHTTGLSQPQQGMQDLDDGNRSPKRRGAAVAIALLSVALAAALATLCISLFVPAGPSEEMERYERELASARDVELAALESGYDWAMTIYDRISEVVQQSRAFQASEQETWDASTMTQEDWQRYWDSAGNAFEQAGRIAGELMKLAALASDDVRSAISAPIIVIGNEYPEIAASWNAIFSASSGLVDDQDDQASASDEDLARFRDAVEDYKRAVQMAGFDTSGW